MIRTTPKGPFGRWLLDRFADRGWESYRQAAEYTKVSHTQLRAYVQGVTPRPAVLIRLAEFFEVPRADLDALLEPESAVMYREGSSGAIMPAPVDPAGRLVPTVFYYAPDGAVVGRSGLDARERAAVDRLLARIDAWRAGRGEEDAGGGEPGAGDPR